jgi:hypothetical protein
MEATKYTYGIGLMERERSSYISDDDYSISSDDGSSEDEEVCNTCYVMKDKLVSEMTFPRGDLRLVRDFYGIKQPYSRTKGKETVLYSKLKFGTIKSVREESYRIGSLRLSSHQRPGYSLKTFRTEYFEIYPELSIFSVLDILGSYKAMMQMLSIKMECDDMLEEKIIYSEKLPVSQDLLNGIAEFTLVSDNLFNLYARSLCRLRDGVLMKIDYHVYIDEEDTLHVSATPIEHTHTLPLHSTEETPFAQVNGFDFIMF